MVRYLLLIFAIFFMAMPYGLAKSSLPKGCKDLNATRVNILPRTDPIEYDYSRSLAKIQSVKLDTVDPYGVHSGSVTQGFMEGAIGMQHKITLDYELIKKGDKVCIWYKQIDVDIHIVPKIVIAKEIKADRCMHRAVLEHEKKHIDVDRDTVNEMAVHMGSALKALLKAKGFSIGPIPADTSKKRAQIMLRDAEGLIKQVAKAMMEERSKRQQKVDSREEYDRVSALCPDFHKRKQNLYRSALKAKQVAQ